MDKIKKINTDKTIGLTLFATGLYAYITTLAPTVLEGDAALFQYTPYVLGVTYPTGFPLYILLGKLWLTLFPFGEVAWRMNLFSALCSATALPLLYNAGRRLFSSAPRSISARLVALTAVLTFATIPTFWRWSTEAKTYALNILLFSFILYLLSLHLEKRGKYQKRSYRFWSSPLALPALLLGLQISVHNTGVLLIPGLFLLVWLQFRQFLSGVKNLLIHLSLLAAPGLFYLYIPLRAEWLIASYGRAEAIGRGLLADFYQSGFNGLIRYFTATDFTGGVVTNWGLVPTQFFTDYVPLLTNNLTTLGVILGVVGGLTMTFMHPRIFWPLFLIYAVPIPFVLTYGQGEQSAFLLPSFLIFSLFIGNSLTLVEWLLAKLPIPKNITQVMLPLIFITLTAGLFFPQARYNFNWLDAKWSRAIYAEWADAFNHQMEQKATILADWGDLTPFWYMQLTEKRRPDLRGLYPPTEAVVTDWQNGGGNNLYVAGPVLQDWADGIEERYRLLPWGRLTRLASRTVEPQTLLPTLPHPLDTVFNNQLRLIGADYPPRAVEGYDYAVTLTWQVLDGLPPDTTISLRLSQADAIVAQLDDTLVSGWFPVDTLPPGQYGLSYILIPVPQGTLPGKYRLQMVAYTSYKQPWVMKNGETLLDFGEVEIALAAKHQTAGYNNSLSGYDFNGEIELAEYEYTVSRVGQGKGFGVKLMWRSITQPVDNYTLLAELVDINGNLLRSVRQQPVGGRSSTGGWQPAQFVRDQINLVLPASSPVGEKAVQVRLSWLRPDDSKLNVRHWWLPVGDNLTLNWLKVTEKKGRTFVTPKLQYITPANFDNKVGLLGYNQLKNAEHPDGLQVSQAECVDSCQFYLDFYWQGLAEMEQLYLIFIHVVDEQGQIIAQYDHVPGKGGKQPTSGWLPGEVVTDPVNLIIPPDTPPGRYSIRLGMYLPSDGIRLPALDNNEGQVIADFVEVGAVLVTP